MRTLVKRGGNAHTGKKGEMRTLVKKGGNAPTDKKGENLPL
jgi:hypothetical protein